MRRRGLTAAGLIAFGGAVLLGAAATGPNAGIRFTDVAGQTAFDYVSNNHFTGRKFFPQPMCGGVAVLDVDLDGRPDLYFTNGARLPELVKTDKSFYSCLLRNRGGGRFEDVTARAGLEGAQMDFSYGVATGDFDNDGDTDLFVCNAGPNVLYRNNGDGTFTDVTAGSGLDDKTKDLLSVCAAFFDYDRDGLPDLVVSQYTFWSPAADRLCNLGGTGEQYCHPGTYKSVPHSLYRNLGGGRFANVTEASGFAASPGKGMGIGIADFNADGWLDVFVANDTEPNFLYLNRGNGKFEEEAWRLGVAYDEQGSVVSGMGADVKDYDNDGFVDIFYNNLQTQIWALFQNDRGQRFNYASPRSGIGRMSRRFSGWSNAFVDYDNDGWKDIYSSNGDVDNLGENAEQHDTLFRNLGDGRFEDVSAELGEDFLRMGYQRGSAVVDLDGNGFLDLVVTSLNRKPRILLSSGGNAHHWLMVDLVGRRSGRDAIGATLELTLASGRKLYNHVSVSVGFMSSSDRRVHFGLGEERSVRSLRVVWPSGTVQELTGVAVDRVTRVEEPS